MRAALQRHVSTSGRQGASHHCALLPSASTFLDLMAPIAIHVVYCGAWCVPPTPPPTPLSRVWLPNAAVSCGARRLTLAAAACRGYGSKFRAIKTEIEKAFPGQTTVTGEATPGATGYLEVQVVGGELLHSKKNGMGYVDTADKMQHMCVAHAARAWARASLTLTAVCSCCALTR